MFEDLRHRIHNVEISLNDQGAFTNNHAPLLYYKRAEITYLSPNVGPDDRATEVAVHGYDFTTQHRCWIYDSYVPTEYVSPSLLLCTITGDGTDLLYVGISITDGHDDSLVFYTRHRPIISSLYPPSGAGEGFPVTIYGDYFVDGNDTLCLFGLKLTRPSVVNSTFMVCPTPNHDTDETVEVRITNNGQYFSETYDLFTFVQHPQIRSVFPISGGEGTELVIHGDHFAKYDHNAFCYLNETQIYGVIYDNSYIVCTLPELTNDTYFVRVSLDGVTKSTNTSLFFGKRSGEPLVITGLYPPSVPNRGNVELYVYGQDFRNLSSTMRCRFNYTVDIDAVDQGNGVYTCDIPWQESELPLVQVSSVDFVWQAIDLSPYNYSVQEDSVSFSSLNTPNLRCRFIHGQNIQAIYDNPTTLRCFNPSWELHTCDEDECGYNASVTVEITDNLKDWTAPWDLLYHREIVLNRIEPKSGDQGGDTTVTIHGSYFLPTEEIRCRFGDAWVPGVYVNDTHIECQTPSFKEGSYYVSVSLNNQNYQTLQSKNFTFLTPHVYSIYPRAVPQTGTWIEVTGMNFRKDPYALATFGTYLSCLICDEYWVYGRFVDDQTMECLIPPMPFAPPPKASIAINSQLYTCAVEVTNNRQQFSTSNVELTFYHMEVQYMEPDLGEISGGTIITVHGFGFLRHQEMRCKFGNIIVNDTVYISSTVITCKAPPLPFGDYEVQISNNLAHDFIGNNLLYHAYEPIAINEIYPSTGITFANTPVAIVGENFYNSSYLKCRFDDHIVDAKMVDSSLILCTAPGKNSSVSIVQVTMNMREWVGILTFTHEDLPAGYYLDGYTSRECPIGSYCPSSNTHLRPTNYTLCPKGTFQRWPGQTSCEICPRQYYCPFEGMRLPLYCPPGYVCEVPGIQQMGKPCPPGHYCEEGTDTDVVEWQNIRPRPTTYGDTIRDGFNIYLQFHQYNRPFYSNRSLVLNDTLIYTYNRSWGATTGVVGGMNIVGSALHTISPVPDYSFYLNWRGERSDIPFGLVDDLPKSHDARLEWINDVGDSRPIFLTAFNSTFFIFTAYDGISRGLYSIDLIQRDVIKLQDFSNFESCVNDPELTCGSPKFMTVFNGVAYFSADDGVYGDELWRSDGTFEGTYLVADLYAGSEDSHPRYLTTLRNDMYFVATNENGRRLWIMRETEDIIEFPLFEQFDGELEGSDIRFLGSMYDFYLFWAADGIDNSGDRSSFTRIWKTTFNQTEAELLIDLSNDSVEPDRWRGKPLAYNITKMHVKYFSNDWKIEGMEDRHTTNLGLRGRVYITARVIGGDDYQVWETDGTLHGSKVTYSPKPCPYGYYCSFATATSSLEYEDDPDYILSQSEMRDDDEHVVASEWAINAEYPEERTVTYPRKCWEGWFCPEASSSPRGAGPCPTGYYCPGIDEETRSWGETGREPLICSQGTYCAGFGNKRTTLCSPGTWNQHEGQSLCQTCPLGYTCLGYADYPTICPPGYICSIQGIDRPDRICPPCYYCPEGTNIWNDHNETTFPTRDDSIYGDISMWPYVEYTKKPILCPAGMYCVGGTGYPDFRRFDFRHAQLCTEGYYCREGSCSATGSGPCEPGFFCPEGSVDMIPAPPGRQIGLWTVKEAGVGWKCPPGTYTGVQNTTECLPCPLGWECTGDGTKVPIGCGPGTYRENDSDFYCVLCPDGTWSNAQNASDGSVCAPCESGFVCAGEGRITEPTTPEFYCPSGQFCHNGTTAARAISDEYNCPGGFWCEEKTKPEVQIKYPCDPGKYCPPGTSHDQMIENICPKDYFCPGGGEIGSEIGGVPDDPRKICGIDWSNPDPEREVNCDEFKCPAGTTSALGSSKRTDCKRKCKPIENPLTCKPLEAMNPLFQSKTIHLNEDSEWGVEFSSDGIVVDVINGKQFAAKGVEEGWILVKVADYVVKRTEWSVIMEILELESACVMIFDIREPMTEEFISATTGAIIRFTADFSDIEETMTYLMHYQLNFYINPKQEDKFDYDAFNDEELYDENFSMEDYVNSEENVKRVKPYRMGPWFEDITEDMASRHQREFIINLYAIHDVQIYVYVEIYHGDYAEYIGSFNRSVYYEVIQTQRSLDLPESHPAYMAVISWKDFGEERQLPLNLRRQYWDNEVVIDLASRENITVDNIQQRLEHEIEASNYYWTFGVDAHQYRDAIVMPWFPFWSNCLEFDSHIFIGFLLENGGRNPAAGYEECILPDPPEAVNPFSYEAIQTEVPDGDSCALELICSYEESLEFSNKIRWWEINIDDTLFYITRDAVENTDYITLDGDDLTTGWQYFSSMVGSDDLVAVSLTSIGDYEEAIEVQVPRQINLLIYYHEVKVPKSKPSRKRIVEIEMEYDKWKKVEDEDFVNEYKISVEYYPFGWADLMDRFQLGVKLYFILFVIIGGVAVLVALIFYIFNRLITQLRYPPGFRLFSLALLSLKPAIVGFVMATIPIFLGMSLLYVMFVTNYNFGFYTGKYLDQAQLDKPRMELYRVGRLGACTTVFSLYVLYVGAQLMIPEEKRTMKHMHILNWSPITWRRFHFVCCAMITCVANLWVLEFSYTEFFSTYVFHMVILFKVMQMFYDIFLSAQFADVLLVSPIVISVVLTEFVITMGADGFIDFLKSFGLELIVIMAERVFLDPELKRLAARIPVYKARLQKKLHAGTGNANEASRFEQYAMDVEDAIEAKTIEPMIESVTVYSAETSTILMIPVILVYLQKFNKETQIPEHYGISSTDLNYYILFSLIIIPFQTTVDIILMNILELFHTWPVYDYLHFCRHRFITRTVHWKQYEDEFDETLERPLQMIDRLCFSSQFYFMNIFTGYGIVFLYIGITMMLRAEYSMFGDPLFPLLAMFMTFTCLLSTRLMMYISKIAGIWRVTRPPRVYMAVEHLEDEYDPMQHLRSEAVQAKFLEVNKTWLINNLERYITQDAIEEHEEFLRLQFENIMRMQQDGGMGNPYEISDDDSHDLEEIKLRKPILTKRQERIVRWWAERGRRLVRMAKLVEGVVASNLENTCEVCGVEDNLTVEQTIPMEDICIMFDGKMRGGVGGIDKMHPVLAWRKFFKETQLFQTLCPGCAITGRAKWERDGSDGMVISEDSSTISEHYNPREIAERLNKTSKKIMQLWLQKARDEIFARGGRPYIPELDFPEVEHEFYEYNLAGPSVININRRLDRAPPSTLGTTVQQQYTTRDDISSDASVNCFFIKKKYPQGKKYGFF